MWQELLQAHSSVQGPWIVLGDFNSVFAADEKIGGRSVVPSSINYIADNLLQLSISDLKWRRGSEYTWTNSSVGARRIMCKLDRVLVNGAWLDEFVNSEVHFLPPTVSDHSLGVVRVVPRPMGNGP